MAFQTGLTTKTESKEEMLRKINATLQGWTEENIAVLYQATQKADIQQKVPMLKMFL